MYCKRRQACSFDTVTGEEAWEGIKEKYTAFDLEALSAGWRDPEGASGVFSGDGWTAERSRIGRKRIIAFGTEIPEAI